MITQKQIIERYGQATPSGEPYLTSLILPYPMRLAWDMKTEVKRIRCHKLVADDLFNVFDDLKYYYGVDNIRKLGIDLFGGCFNYRKMRGGSKLSTHSWGISIDLDPSRNRLKENHQTARFARKAYEPMIDIFYGNNFESLGREKDYDWMHFQVRE